LKADSAEASPVPPVLPPLSLYVHIPWCARKCPYCDFNSHALRGALPEVAYVSALLRDLEQEIDFLQGRALGSVFIGGGTPSLLSPRAIERLLSEVRGLAPWVSEAEVTLEANPGTVDAASLADFRAAGVTRLSLGIQSFDDEMLAGLGRIHGRQQAMAAAEAAHAAGFASFNLDLMFGLPGQDCGRALQDLRTALSLEPPHLSYYQLTVEPNTLFARYPPALPEEDVIWNMQRQGLRALSLMGYERYEVSAYARPGDRCRHNLSYWLFGDYLGIGAAAHGKVSGPWGVRRRWKVKHPQDYLERIGRGQQLGGQSSLGAPEAALEFMMNALRLPGGFATPLFAERTGVPLERIAPILDRAAGRKLLTWDCGCVAPTPLGLRYLNDLISMFLD
jgi:putative oxygen-independent coproporphyrinogen III oxidase